MPPLHHHARHWFDQMLLRLLERLVQASAAVLAPVSAAERKLGSGDAASCSGDGGGVCHNHRGNAHGADHAWGCWPPAWGAVVTPAHDSNDDTMPCVGRAGAPNPKARPQETRSPDRLLNLPEELTYSRVLRGGVGRVAFDRASSARAAGAVVQ